MGMKYCRHLTDETAVNADSCRGRRRCAGLSRLAGMGAPWIGVLLAGLSAGNTIAAEPTPTVAPQAMTRVSGNVVDERQHPIAGAFVGIAGTQPVLQYVYERRELAAPLYTRTDRAGEFVLLVPKEFGSVTVIARAPGYAPAPAVISFLGDVTRLSALRLSAGLQRRGRVVDETRKPVSGAAVTASRFDEFRDTTPADAKTIRVVSDDQGRFVIAGLEAGSYKLVVQRDGYATRTLPEHDWEATKPEEPFEIELYRGTFLTGRVSDHANHPIAGASITAEPGMDPKLVTKSGSDGVFRIGPFVRGADVRISAAARGFRTAQAMVVMPAGDLALTLDRNGALRGRVLDADSSKPVKSFKVLFHSRGEQEMHTETPGTRAFRSEDGRFEWPDIFPGAWTFTVQAPGYQPLEVAGIEIPQGQPTEEVELSLKKGNSLRGRIFDKATGLPVAGAQVSYEDRHLTFDERLIMPPLPSVVSDRNGLFAFDGVPPGHITVMVSAAGYAHARQDLTVGTTNVGGGRFGERRRDFRPTGCRRRSHAGEGQRALDGHRARARWRDSDR